jgi:4-hydroxybenzoate polyprenyltransferase
MHNAGASDDSDKRDKTRSKLGVIAVILGITHPRAIAVFTLITLAVAVIAEHGLPPRRLTIILILAMALIQSAVGIFNEYYDRDLDAIAKPSRPIPSGLVSARWAFRLGWITVVLGLCAAATLGLFALLVLALGAAMGILYSVRFKRSVLSWLPYAIAYPIVPLWVCVSLGKFSPEMLLIYPIALPFSIGIHLCNQLRDFNQDAQQGMRGLVQYLGEGTASKLCLGLLLFSPLPPLVITYRYGGNTLLFLACAMIHWWFVTSRLHHYWEQHGKCEWPTMFKRLRLSGPLLLIGWVLSLPQ